MARTAITGACNVVKFALMTPEELLLCKDGNQNQKWQKFHKQCKARLYQANQESLLHKGAILCANFANDKRLRERSQAWLESHM